MDTVLSEEPLDHFRVTLLAGNKEWCCTIFVSLVDIDTILGKKSIDHFRVALRTGDIQ